MIERFKRSRAIRRYVTRLSQELERRFGVQRFYSIEQITQAAQGGGFTTAFIAYAHATFCSRHDFDTYYQSLGVTCTYDELRAVIAHRYFSDQRGFDAASVVRMFRPPYREENQFYESGLGTGAWTG